MKSRIRSLFFALALFIGIHQAAAQGTTAFVYQGQLRDNGTNVNGTYTMIFALYDAVTNGDLIAGPITNNTTLANGLFTVNLDFGAGAFNGSARYLDIAITNGVTTQELSPREQVLPVPYAIMANSASNLLGTLPPSQLPGSVLTNNASGINLNGSFTGNGAGLTNLNAVVPGTINETSITIGATNMIAPLTATPTMPTNAIGSAVLSGYGVLSSVAVAGSYAYMVDGLGNLQIFDVSMPSSPTNVGSIGIGGGGQRSVAVAGRYAYVAGNGFQIFDVSNPSLPAYVGSAATGSGPFGMALAGRYAYVVNNGSSTLQVIDVNNPSAPVDVGSVGTSNEPYSIAVAGRYAYVATYQTLEVFDVSSPTNPVSIGSVASGGATIAVVGRYAYLGNTSASLLQIVDVSNPTNPVIVGSANTGGGGPRSVAVAGRYAYLVTFNTFEVFDVSTPSSPVLVGTIGSASYPIIPWSVTVAGRYAYVVIQGNDMPLPPISATLRIFDFSGAYIQQFEAGAMETGTLQTRDTVTVGNNLNVSGGLTVAGSALISGGLSVNDLVGGATTNILIGGHTFYITNGIIMNVQ
jgi:hypothetical protein